MTAEAASVRNESCKKPLREAVEDMHGKGPLCTAIEDIIPAMGCCSLRIRRSARMFGNEVCTYEGEGVCLYTRKEISPNDAGGDAGALKYAITSTPEMETFRRVYLHDPRKVKVAPGRSDITPHYNCRGDNATGSRESNANTGSAVIGDLHL